MTTEAEGRVLAGMAWLDFLAETEPQAAPWLDRLDLDTLELLSISRCVLGQLRPGGLDYLHWLDSRNVDWMYSHGFTVSPGQLSHYYELTAAWHRLVLARRAQRGEDRR